MKRLLTLLICGIMLSFNGFAKVVAWQIVPEYDELKPYSDGVYYCKKDSKWGLVAASGKILLQPQFDYVYPMIDGYALVLNKEGNRYRIKCIIDSDYDIVTLNEAYYTVNSRYTYFSDGKLPVQNKSGKYGFINTDGAVAVKCQFDYVHPFSNGFASVMKGQYAYYITERYDRNPNQNILPVDFNYGEITFASTFYKGQAVVAYNGKSAIINTQGKKVGNYNGKLSCNKHDYTIEGCGSTAQNTEYKQTNSRSFAAYAQDGLYGFKQDGNVISYPYFSAAEAPSESGYAIVTLNGKMGLVAFLDGEVLSFVTKANQSVAVESGLKATSAGAIEKCDYIVSIPSNLSQSEFSVLLDNGKGSFVTANTNVSGRLLKTEFVPQTATTKGKTVTIAAEVSYMGIPLHKFSNSYSVTYPVVTPVVEQPTTYGTTATTTQHTSKLSIAGPAVKTERANADDNQVVYAIISNHTGQTKTFSATLLVPTKGKQSQQTITLAAGASKQISVTITDVAKTETMKATLSLSTGEKSTRDVTLKPYY